MTEFLVLLPEPRATLGPKSGGPWGFVKPLLIDAEGPQEAVQTALDQWCGGVPRFGGIATAVPTELVAKAEHTFTFELTPYSGVKIEEVLR